MINIVEFIKSGNMKGIDFSMSREKLIKLLGDTGDKVKSKKKDKNPSFFKYDKVEFYFMGSEDNRLKGIVIQPNIYPFPSGEIGFDYD